MRVKGLTFKALRAAIREFVDAGYDATDIVHMLDWTPRNEARPHSGLYGIVHGTAWIARVFDPWRDSHGTPLASPGARRRAAEHRRRNAAAERAAQREHERIQLLHERATAPAGYGRDYYLACARLARSKEPGRECPSVRTYVPTGSPYV
ncbi:hypothetical protein [Demequina litorisediminis]|uniref:Uncharacterized protein n=1 Tax=Demequina litorisediminis TaxID=1849022 RepID=A0ABQ6IJ65_9MICO|nr:hypothetical protein [Demequina litorisediminis]GMA37880.1 hypothetical protein GCM10025876_40840 [Demequina litorisediminis]